MKQHEQPTPEPAAPTRRIRHYLVTAHHEGDHRPVLAKAEELMEEGSARFHILVPATPPRRDSWVTDEDDARRLASTRMRMALDDFESIGAEATAEIASPDLLDALKDALAAAAYDGVIVSTAPDGIAERLGLDFVHRLQRAVAVPVIHLVARHATKA